MTFDMQVQLLLERFRADKAPRIMTLRIGRSVMFDELPAYQYEFVEAWTKPGIISLPTKSNLKFMQDNIPGVRFRDVYKVDNWRNAWSTYVTGTVEDVPFIFARLEGPSAMSGSTMMYFANKTRQRFYDFIPSMCQQELPGGITRVLHPHKTEYFLTATGEWHRLDGPAIEYKSGPSVFAVKGLTFKQEDLENWAKHALIYLNKPHTPENIDTYLRNYLRSGMDSVL